MAASANALKIAENIRGSRRTLLWAMVVAILLSVLGSSWIELALGYRYGAVNLSGYYTGLVHYPFNFRDVNNHYVAQFFLGTDQRKNTADLAATYKSNFFLGHYSGLVQDVGNLTVISFAGEFYSAVSFCKQGVIATDTNIGARVKFGTALPDND